MALVDFYQLAALHKLRWVDPGFSSTHSHPLCMSASPSVEPDEVPPSLPSPVQPRLKPPERSRDAVLPVSGVTPLSHGSSIRQNQEGNTDRVEGYQRDDYEEYVDEDLKYRVFVDFEVFMKTVLHVPEDWNSQWKEVMEVVEADPEFRKHYTKYRGYCDDRISQEALFYEPLAEMANAVLDVWSRSESRGTDRGMPQIYRVNSTTKLQGGIFNKANLSPDLVVLHKDCVPKPDTLHWANALHVLEVKPHGGAICDGKGMPKLVVNGEYTTSSSWILP